MPTSFDALHRELTLRPIAPLVLAAWHDGHLTPAELLAIRDALEGVQLDDGAREALRKWLDPESPPPPRALRTLEREVGSWLLEQLPPPKPRSLPALSATLAEAHFGATGGPQRELLASLYAGLSPDQTFSPRGPEPTPLVDPLPRALDDAQRAALRKALDGEHAEIRDEVRALLDQPEFRFASEHDTRAYREQVLAWLRKITTSGLLDRLYPKGLGGGRALGRSVASFETLAFFDLSLVVKYGVQTGLFAGAIENLGTARHHALLPEILRGDLLGCFAMTERGHGSNVRSLLTTARYDPDSQSFVIRTPSLAAGKEWIGSAAVHGRMAVVFAQLETLDESYGVHAFVVPIRDADGNPMPGVRIEDCGEKMGLNGVDNGRLWFDDVRVGRDALLDRFGQVDVDGTYQSRIPSSSKRFFTMLSTLVGGRISVGGGATSAAKVGLGIAIRYAAERRQFPDATGREKRLLDYLTHQRRLMPRLAAAYAFSFGQHELVRRSSKPGLSEREGREAETLAAGFKALSTWQAIDTLQQCRECCGGQGYLSANRIDALRTDSDVFTTFEGDNTVLMQLVANNVLRALERQRKAQPVRAAVRSVVAEVVDAVSSRNPIAALREGGDAALRATEVHSALMREREQSLLDSLARRVGRRIREGQDGQAALEACQDHALALGRAHIEQFVLTSFHQAALGEPLLQPLCTLYGAWRIEADLAWFLEQELLSPAQARATRSLVNELAKGITPQSLDLIDAFGIPKSCLGPLADPDYVRTSGLAEQSG